MNDDVQRWKEKYLSSLEQQEQLEHRWETRLDLLRRGLVRSSLAAEGADKAVDQCMQELREIIRGDQMDGALAALIPRLEKTVLDSEQRRRQRSEQNIAGITALTHQLLSLDLPREVRKALKRFSKHIDERASQTRELPALLAELGVLQEKALAVMSSPESAKPGLLERLFGSRDSEAASAAATTDAAGFETPAAEKPAAPATEPGQQPAPVSVTPEQPATAPAISTLAESAAPATHSVSAAPSRRTASLDSLPLRATLITGEGDATYALPVAPEPGYSAVAPHIAASLLGLLDELELPARHQPQGDALRERMKGGLNWYELVPVLDDLGVLVLAVAGGGQQEFTVYLKQLNERLTAFVANLDAVHAGYSASLDTARALDDDLRGQVSGLQLSVQDAVDLEALKRAVEQRIEGLLGTMNEYQQQREIREREVSGHLQVLVERVSSMEQEAKVFREHLEEQRQKALTDPLTELPNRAAWSERLELEVARSQRYGGELLMAVLDIDHFKRINDEYGHLAGDKVLRIIASELRKRLRKTDFIARFGGEEFVLLFPSTPVEGGRQLMETLRADIEACPFHFRGERVTVTLSAGLTVFGKDEASEQVLERADQALYRAKHSGRNRVVVDSRGGAGTNAPA
jgi:diguanylate cyclase